MKGCKGSALYAVAAASSSGRAFVCEPHGTGELPLEPARIPNLDVPSALVPIPSDDPVVMSVVQGWARAGASAPNCRSRCRQAWATQNRCMTRPRAPVRPAAG